MLLRGYVVVSSLLLVVLGTAAFRQRPAQTQGEITVERINVVDRDGTLRMVISNKDRMHPGVMDGKTIDRPRPYAGIIFFNDEGDEARRRHLRRPGVGIASHGVGRVSPSIS